MASDRELYLARTQRAQYHAVLMVARRLLSQAMPQCDATLQERILVFLQRDTREHGLRVRYVNEGATLCVEDETSSVAIDVEPGSEALCESIYHILHGGDES